MTTPLNELMDTSENINDEMRQDDCNSQIVNEILKEINQPEENVSQNENIYMNQQEQLNRQMEPVSQSEQIQPNELDQMEQDNVTDNVKDLIKNKLIEKLKDPLIVVGVVFLLNSPIISSLLVKYLPKLFSSGVNKGIQWLSIFLKSLIAGIVFFSLKTML